MGEVKRESLFQLFWSFFHIGIFTIGGGMASIPLIQAEVVEKKRWMTTEECLDCIAIAQSLPGVIAINMATYIGQFRRGLAGSIAATLGVTLPSYLIIIAIVELLHGIGDNAYVTGAMAGLKVAATALILFSVYTVGRAALKDGLQWVLCIASFLLITFLGINAIFPILGGILIGILRGKLGGDKG